MWRWHKHVSLLFVIITLPTYVAATEVGFPIDTTITYCGGNAHAYWSDFDIAFDGNLYFATWFGEHGPSGRYKVLGARLTEDGELLDLVPIVISRYPVPQYYVRVAAGGGYFLVVWLAGSYIYMTRVTPSGVIIDTMPIWFQPPSGGEGGIDITFDGTNFFIVWSDGYGYNIYGAKVSPAGEILDTNILVATGNYKKMYPRVESNSVCYFVVWRDERNLATGGRDIYGARLSIDGTILDSSIEICTHTGNQEEPYIAYDGENFFVVWHDERTFPTRIFGARINTGGIVLDTNGFLIYAPPSYNNAGYPTVAYDGNNYLVAFDRESYPYDNIYGVRVTPSGEILDLITIINNEYSFPVVAPGNSGWMVISKADRPCKEDCYVTTMVASRVGADGHVPSTDGIILHRRANPHEYCVTSFGDECYLVVWEDYRAYSACYDVDIYGIRLNSAGYQVDSTAFPICIQSNRQYTPEVAACNTLWLVIWRDEIESWTTYYVYGARVAFSGTLLDTNSIPIVTSAAWNPTVIGGMTQFLVVWSNDSSQIYGKRVNSLGEILDPDGFQISPTTGEHWLPRGCFDGNNYFVVWTSSTGVFSDIYGARVTQDGTVLDINGIPISTACEDQHSPDVTYGDNMYFVVWVDERNSDQSIYGARLTTDGQVLDTDGILISVGDDQYYPRVTFDGTNFVVTWTRRISAVENIYDIRGATVATDGTVLDTFLVAHDVTNMPTGLARGPDDRVLITYTHEVDSIAHQPVFELRSWGRFYPITHVEEPHSRTLFNLQVYPKVATHAVTIQLTLQKASNVTIHIYDICGRLIQTIHRTYSTPNTYRICWHGDDQTGNKVTSGVYFIRIVAGNVTESAKVVILR